jgi:hypothetical protein
MKPWLWLLLGLLVSGITWLYLQRILNPWRDQVGLREAPPITQMGDLYSPWVGARELLLHRRNPYGIEVSHEIQTAFYGHPIDQEHNEPGKHLINEQRFAYPVYTVFILAPIVHIRFSLVRSWAPVALGVLAFSTVLLALDLLPWGMSWPAQLALAILVLSSPQIVQGLRLEQLAMLVGFLLIAGAWCARRNRLLLAAILLAFSTIKPQMSFFPLCFFLVWVAGSWKKRWPLLGAFVLSLCVLIGAGELLLPGWIGYFLAAIRAYRIYFPTSSPLSAALGGTVGIIVGCALALSTVLLSWRSRENLTDQRGFVNVFSAFLIVTILAFPLLTPFNQVLLILPTTLLLRAWSDLRRFPQLVFIAIAAWPWAISAAMLLLSARAPLRGQLPLLPAFLTLFYPGLLGLLLMTRRKTA